MPPLLPRPPRTALVLRRNPLYTDKLSFLFCVSNFLSVTAEGNHNSEGWRLCSGEENLHIFISEGRGRSALQHSRGLK